MAAVHGVQGDRSSAKELLAQASVAGEEVAYNTGILNIMDGNYAEAVSNFGSKSSYNKALAQLLEGSIDQAVSSIDNSIDKESAQGYYLKAVASSRQNNVDGVVSNLKSAIALDSSYKSKASKDREFLSFFENVSFSDVVK